jgi:WD40 repeat protein
VTGARADIASIADRIQHVAAEGVVGIAFLESTPVFVLGEEALLFVGADGAVRLPVHSGGILSFAGEGRRIVTGGDDGHVVVTNADGTSETVASDDKGRWIDHVAFGPDGAIAWSAGKTAYVRTGRNERRQRDMPSTPAGLAFMPKGFRLAVAHYNGVSLWFPNLPAEPQRLEWKGSHLGIAVSRDGRFVVTAMQEPTLHGWRLADGKDMRMSGYSAQVRSFGWTADGAFLATAGSEQLILWPFSGKDGPMGKQPHLLAPSAARAVVVACHPRQPVVAIGFADGMVLLVRVEDGAEILARRPLGSEITALGWSADGAILAFGAEDGEAGFLRL